MKLVIVTRVMFGRALTEYLGNIGDIHYNFTIPEHFGEKEISAFVVEGDEETLNDIYKYCNSTFMWSTDDVIAMKMKREDK